jgi:hypothetical protein
LAAHRVGGICDSFTGGVKFLHGIAWIRTDTREITGPLFTRHCDLPFPRDACIKRRHYIAPEMKKHPRRGGIAEGFLCRGKLRVQRSPPAFSDAAEDS